MSHQTLGRLLRCSSTPVCDCNKGDSVNDNNWKFPPPFYGILLLGVPHEVRDLLPRLSFAAFVAYA